MSISSWVDMLLQSPWRFNVAGAGLSVVGLALLRWALLGDRSRGRRRCPKCWYDLRGTPGLTCSECGYTARREPQFHRNRRRWSAGALSGLLLVSAAGLFATPIIRRRGGWLSLVPTPILLRHAPTASEEYVVGANGRPALTPVARELGRRRVKSSLTDAQWRYLLTEKDILHTRPQWPAGARVAVQPRLPDWLGRAKLTFHTEAEPNPLRVMQTVPSSPGSQRVAPAFWLQPAEAGAPVYPVICDITWRADRPRPRNKIKRAERGEARWSGTVNLPVEIVPTGSRVLVPVDTPNVNEAIARSLWLRISRNEDGGMRAGFRWSVSVADQAILNKLAIGLRLEFACRGNVVFTSRVFISARYCMLFEDGFPWFLSKDLIAQHAPSMIAAPDEWTVHIESDEELALANLGKEHQWAGSLDLPLGDLLWAQAKGNDSQPGAKASLTDVFLWPQPPGVAETRNPTATIDAP